MKTLFAAVLISLNFACGHRMGTETGNPVKNNDDLECNVNTNCPPPGSDVKTMVDLFTKKVMDCATDNTLTETTVNQKIYTQRGVNIELPIAEKTFEELFVDVNAQMIAIDPVAYSKCSDEIKKLTCNSQTFVDAYAVMDPNNFALIHRLFRANAICQTVFKSTAQP